MRKIEDRLHDALRDIIEGKTVKRARHELRFDGKGLTQKFIEALGRQSYVATTVGRVNVRPGERVPAFLIESGVAWFGWVFWEQFTSWKTRKLWGSVVKNERGDWDIQIPETRSTTIYANESLKLEMDIDHPPEF